VISLVREDGGGGGKHGEEEGVNGGGGRKRRRSPIMAKIRCNWWGRKEGATITVRRCREEVPCLFGAG